MMSWEACSCLQVSPDPACPSYVAARQVPANEPPIKVMWTQHSTIRGIPVMLIRSTSQESHGHHMAFVGTGRCMCHQGSRAVTT